MVVFCEFLLAVTNKKGDTPSPHRGGLSIRIENRQHDKVMWRLHTQHIVLHLTAPVTVNIVLHSIIHSITLYHFATKELVSASPRSQLCCQVALLSPKRRARFSSADSMSSPKPRRKQNLRKEAKAQGVQTCAQVRFQMFAIYSTAATKTLTCRSHKGTEAMTKKRPTDPLDTGPEQTHVCHMGFNHQRPSLILPRFCVLKFAQRHESVEQENHT